MIKYLKQSFYKLEDEVYAICRGDEICVNEKMVDYFHSGDFEYSRVLINNEELFEYSLGKPIKNIKSIEIIFKITFSDTIDGFLDRPYKHSILITEEHLAILENCYDRLKKVGMDIYRAQQGYYINNLQQIDMYLQNNDYYHPEDLLEELFAIYLLGHNLKYDNECNEWYFDIKDKISLSQWEEK